MNDMVKADNLKMYEAQAIDLWGNNWGKSNRHLAKTCLPCTFTLLHLQLSYFSPKINILLSPGEEVNSGGYIPRCEALKIGRASCRERV